MLSDHHLDEFVEKGYLFVEDLVPHTLWKNLQKELLMFLEQDLLTPAGIGQNATRKSEMRSDHIYWIQPHSPSPAQEEWLKWVNSLQTQLNRTLYLGANSYEGHLAQYPSGSFYKAHLDQHKGKNSRILTIILYLNDNWKPQHAGQLKFYNDTSLGLDGNAMVIEPTGGKIALFLSNDYWHEVLPSNHSRLSLTGWLTKT